MLVSVDALAADVLRKVYIPAMQVCKNFKLNFLTKNWISLFSKLAVPTNITCDSECSNCRCLPWAVSKPCWSLADVFSVTTVSKVCKLARQVRKKNRVSLFVRNWSSTFENLFFRHAPFVLANVWSADGFTRKPATFAGLQHAEFRFFDKKPKTNLS